jgi:2'-5' RNA ligase
MSGPDYPAPPADKGRREEKRPPKGEKTIRTFAAVFPSPAVREALHSLRTELEPQLPGLRWVAAENLHFTLRFFGNLTRAEIDRAARALDSVAPHCVPFDLELSGVGVFPGWKRPRVLWVGCGAGGNTLEALARSLEREFRAARLGRSDKPFRAHLTLGRWRDPRGLDPAPARSACEGRGAVGSFRVEEARIMQSTLGPGGPTYEVLHRANLGA